MGGGVTVNPAEQFTHKVVTGVSLGGQSGFLGDKYQDADKYITSITPATLNGNTILDLYSDQRTQITYIDLASPSDITIFLGRASKKQYSESVKSSSTLYYWNAQYFAEGSNITVPIYLATTPPASWGWIKV